MASGHRGMQQAAPVLCKARLRPGAVRARGLTAVGMGQHVVLSHGVPLDKMSGTQVDKYTM